MGQGLDATLDRVKARNELLRRDLIRGYMEKMSIAQTGPVAQMLLEHYRPDVLVEDKPFDTQKMTDWLVAQYPQGGMTPWRAS